VIERFLFTDPEENVETLSPKNWHTGFPIMPMEAALVPQLPIGNEWQYEPKWDGFRCIAFRDGTEVMLQSKSGKLLNRYFPELLSALREVKAGRFVIDGEIVIADENGSDFDQLLQRIHPAASRVKMLSEEYPAHFEIFDLLSDDKGASLLAESLSGRRQKLERFAKRYVPKNSLLRLSPMTTDIAAAADWLKKQRSSLDGIVAKRRDLPYAAGERSAMKKFKRIRTADCVVGGFRYAGESRNAVGSLLLGLYEDGLLHHVGFVSGIKANGRKTLLKKLKPLIQPPGFTGRAPGGPSRWSTERSAQWEPLKPELVVEVSFDHVTANRFRHGTKILRWRPDKAPTQCGMEQIAV
jgi:ATP-dependent DNA ligase